MSIDNLFYEVYESRTETKNPPIILLHGLLGMGKNLGSIARYLSSNNKVISMDFPNHGSSSHTQNISLDMLANSVLSILNDLKIEKINLLGHSLGGKVAMLFALRNPKKVNKLIVADMAPVSYPTKLSLMFDALSYFDLSGFNSRKEISLELSHHIQDEQVIQLLIQNIKKVNDEFSWRFNLSCIRKGYADLCRGLSIPEDGCPFKNPMLLIYGKKSNYWHSDYGETLNKLFLKFKILGIEDAGHWIHIDQPNTFNEQVSLFINN